jgi:hypothetical protein
MAHRLVPASAVLSVAVFIGVAVRGPEPVNAALTGPTRVECGADSYVIGLEGRTGLWIDALAPVCARWDRSQLRAMQGRAMRALDQEFREAGMRRQPFGTTSQPAGLLS